MVSRCITKKFEVKSYYKPCNKYQLLLVTACNCDVSSFLITCKSVKDKVVSVFFFS